MGTDRLRALLGDEVEGWPVAFERLAPEMRDEALQAAYAAWIAGELTADPERDREIGRVLSSLPEEWCEPVIIDRVSPNADEVRRWCWGRDWFLFSDDEDLLLMDDRYVEPLLDEARRGCTKRDYALGLVMHHARDSAHHAAFAGASELRRRLSTIGSWLPWARAASSPEAVDYLERLAGYSVERAVSAEEVERRVLDLRRCDPRASERPEVRRVGANWVAPLALANVTPGEFFVEVATGKMWAEKRG